MGWENYHLHTFKIFGQEYGDPQNDEGGDRGTRDEHEFRLMDLDLVPGTTFEYLYDFGDGWLHDLEVEKISSDGDTAQIPCCLAGEFSGPPEDVGGLGGYYEYLRALKNRRHPEYKEWQAWRGPFDPLKFDLVLLTYLRENKVIGTQSTGNLPLKPAQEISAGFVDPPIWKFELGDYVSHVRAQQIFGRSISCWSWQK